MRPAFVESVFVLRPDAGREVLVPDAPSVLAVEGVLCSEGNSSSIKLSQH